MDITCLKKQDQKSVLELLKKVTGELRKNGIHQWDRFYPNRFVIAEDLKQQNLYGVKLDDKVIGVVTVDGNFMKEYQTIQWHGDPGGAACIHRLAVHPDYQGKGIGKMLLEFAEKMAFSQGFTSIRLDVFSKNPSAIAMYRKFGYLEKGKVSFPMRKDPYFCFEKLLKEGE